jgi:hypothetical protein
VVVVVVVVVVVAVVVVVRIVTVPRQILPISRSLLFHCITSSVQEIYRNKRTTGLANRLKRLPSLTFSKSLGLKNILSHVLYLLNASTGQ